MIPRSAFLVGLVALTVGGCSSSQTEQAAIEEPPPAPNIMDFESAYGCSAPQIGTIRGQLRGRRWLPNEMSSDEPLAHVEVHLELRDAPSSPSSLTLSDTTDFTYGGFIFRGVPSGQFADLLVAQPSGSERVFTGILTDSLFLKCWMPRPGDDRDVINMPVVE
jgi:hypothetical protein